MEDDRRWYHLAVCQGMKTEYFYDDYEADPIFARVMDSICLSCPVQKRCLAEGIRNKEYGLWGGVFLDNGKVDANKNMHKSEDVWDRFEGIDR